MLRSNFLKFQPLDSFRIKLRLFVSLPATQQHLTLSCRTDLIDSLCNAHVILPHKTDNKVEHVANVIIDNPTVCQVPDRLFCHFCPKLAQSFSKMKTRSILFIISFSLSWPPYYYKQHVLLENRLPYVRWRRLKLLAGKWA